MANLSGKFFGIDMTSPSFLGSGPLSYNAEGLLAAFHAGAGRVTTKTLRLKKAINPIPHIGLPSSSNLRGSILNTEKWSDITWEQWVEEEFQKLVGHPGVLIPSISHTAPEPEVITSPVEKTGVVNLIECVAHTKDTLVPVVRAMRARTDLPELAKLTFHWGDDLYRAAEEAREAGANGLTVIDSIGPILVIDIETYQPVLGGIRNQAWMPEAASDFGLPMTLAHSDQKTLNQIQGVVTAGVPFFKVYTTYDGFLLEDHQLLDSMLAVKAAGGLMKVHAENYAIIKHKQKPFLTAGYTPPHFHPLSRPEIAEAEAIHPFLALGEITGVHLHIMHVSSASGANEVAWARARGQVIVGDTCPQYLLLTEKEYQRAGFEGVKFVCSLPLRKNSDQTALWKTLSLGDLKTIGTDHCLFMYRGQKGLGRDQFTKIPGGIPGIETRIALLYIFGVKDGRISLNQWVDMCCTTPAQSFGIYPRKGSLTINADADLVIFNPEKDVTISNSRLHEHVDYTSYVGMKLHGYPETMISRGNVLVRDFVYRGQKGQGLFLAGPPVNYETLEK